MTRISKPPRFNPLANNPKNPQNPSIRIIRDADEKGRIADESDYADYTDFQFNLSITFSWRNLEGVAMAPPQSGIFNMSHFENLLVNQLVPNAQLKTTIK